MLSLSDTILMLKSLQYFRVASVFSVDLYPCIGPNCGYSLILIIPALGPWACSVASSNLAHLGFLHSHSLPITHAPWSWHCPKVRTTENNRHILPIMHLPSDSSFPRAAMAWLRSKPGPRAVPGHPHLIHGMGDFLTFDQHIDKDNAFAKYEI